MSSKPPLSVVFASTQPWPEGHMVLDAVWRPAQEVGAEVLFGVSGPHACPPEGSYPGLRIVTIPGASVFELRQEAIAASRGDIIALTEDHCRPDPDWCAGILKAHGEHPEADIIGGGIRNGACDPPGWAGFLISNGPFLPPLGTRRCNVPSGVANVSYKRRALGESVGGLDEGAYREQLQAKGAMFFCADGMEVLHIQALPPITLAVLNFQGGRSLAGTKRSGMSLFTWLRRLVVLLLLPARVAVHAPRLVLLASKRSRDYRKDAIRCAPWLVVFLTAYGLGQLLGHLFGVGSSKYYLR